MDCSKVTKPILRCDPGGAQEVFKMSTAGKAYTTVGSRWRKTDYRLEFHAFTPCFPENRAALFSMARMF